jgi:hypothetical protein
MIRVLLSSQHGEEVDVAADEDGLGDDRYGPANLKADFQTRPLTQVNHSVHSARILMAEWSFSG